MIFTAGRAEHNPTSDVARGALAALAFFLSSTEMTERTTSAGPEPLRGSAAKCADRSRPAGTLDTAIERRLSQGKNVKMTARSVFVSAVAGLSLAVAVLATAETFNLKLASGHPPGLHYVDLLHEWFIPELKERAKAKGHTVNVIQLYAGSAVKLSETLEGAQHGFVDIGGMCYCFEPSDLMLHAFQVLLPFGTPDPELSVKIARSVYGQIPELPNAFNEKYNQTLLSLFGQDPYDIYAKFPVNSVADVNGKKIGGAGPNLPWVGLAGSIAVQTTGAIVYNSLQTGVFDGAISFVSRSQGLKLYELAKNYTKVGFGSITFHGVQINNKSMAALPPEPQQILV